VTKKEEKETKSNPTSPKATLDKSNSTKATLDKQKKAAKSGDLTMEELLAEHDEKLKPLEEGETIEGTVVAVTKAGIWLDLGPHGSGLAVGREVAEAGYKDSIMGDKITVSVVVPEMDEGYALLSLRKASRERNWTLLTDLKDKSELIKIKPFDANKGGLLIEYEGIKGFLPVSQLSADNYPRVSDKDEIVNRLTSLVGNEIEVIILDVDQKEGKLIFSEKEARKGEIEEVIEKFSIGETVKGKVTGVVDFGIFMNIDGIEGLVHISEISWDRVEDPKKFAKIGDELDVAIIGKEQDKVSLSLKRLAEDPWAKEVTEIKVGDEIEGEVTRITPFGAFVKITKSVEALVHISELSEDHIANPSEVVEVGKSYKFKVVTVDIENHKLSLSLKGMTQKKADTPKEKTEKKTESKSKKVALKVKEEIKKTAPAKKTKTTKKDA
jgi:small subunit ribosomal protein S1